MVGINFGDPLLLLLPIKSKTSKGFVISECNF